MALIADGTYEQVGTFNGNPLAMAAARAMLTEVLTPATYAHLDRLRDRMADGLQDVIDRHAHALAGGDRRRQGLRIVPARPDPQLPRLPASSTTATATATGWCSPTAARSSRRGARSSSG